MFRYTWAGIELESAIELTELPPREPKSGVDSVVHISLGAVPHNLPLGNSISPRQQVAPAAFLFARQSIAHYLVTDGDRIVAEPEPGVPLSVVGAFLLGRPAAALCYQRGWLALHGSCVVAGERARVFVGPSGAGKSTLLAALERGGFAPLSDDAAILRCSDGRHWAWPTGQRLRLNHDVIAALEKIGRNFGGAQPGLRKLIVPFERPREAPAELASVYLLARAQKNVGVLPVAPVEAVRILMENLNRPQLAQIIRGVGPLLREVTELVSRIGIYRLTIPANVDGLDDAIKLLSAHWNAEKLEPPYRFTIA